MPNISESFSLRQRDYENDFIIEKEDTERVFSEAQEFVKIAK